MNRLSAIAQVFLVKMNVLSMFQPYQILRLEHQHSVLYVELIQVVPERQVVWVRPLALATLSAASAGLNSSLFEVIRQFPPDPASHDITLYDLRQGADLLLPMALFHEALDTEVVPLLAQLGDPKPSVEGDRAVHGQLQAFIHNVWQTHSSLFHNDSADE